MRLTDKECRALTPRSRPYKASDGDGLYLLVNPTGGKYWRLNYRFHTKNKTLALGTYPSIGLKAARLARDEARRQLAQGLDPAFEKQKNKVREKVRLENNFEAVARDWLDKRVRHLSAKHRKRIESVLENDLFPFLGKSPIQSIEAADLLVALRGIERRGSAYTAERARQWCSQIFRYAIACSKADRDVARDLTGALASHKARNHAYLRECDLPEFFQKLEDYPGHTQTQIALKLMALTFVRPQELSHAAWGEFDETNALWRIPAERMKMRSEHLVPLSSQTLALVARLREMKGRSSLLLPSFKNPAMPMHPDSLLRGLHRMGYQGKATAHGFRATASTILNEHGFNRDVIERQLAHSERNKIRAAYNHAEYLPERRNLMEWWGNHLAELSGGTLAAPAPTASSSLQS